MVIYKELALLAVLQLVVGCIPHISSRCVFFDPDWAWGSIFAQGME